jgi:flagellar biosynthesis anti-sigma factor FlgM
MKVDDRVVNYAIDKQHKSTRDIVGKSKTNPLIDKQTIKEKDRSGQHTIVRLSMNIKEAQFIKTVISSEPDVRVDKVSEIKQQIESDSYRIDPDIVAGKLVDAFVAEFNSLF